MSVDFGIRISQNGHDAESATDNQLVFSSKFNTLKHYIITSASITIPANTAAVTGFNVTFNHNLGFVPAVFVYPNDGTYAACILCVPPDLTTAYTTAEPGVVDNCEFSYDLTSTYIKLYLRTYDSGVAPGHKFWGSNPQYVVTFKIYIFTQQIG